MFACFLLLGKWAKFFFWKYRTAFRTFSSRFHVAFSTMNVWHNLPSVSVRTIFDCQRAFDVLRCYPLVLHTPCQMSMVGGKIFNLIISTTYGLRIDWENGPSTISCTPIALLLPQSAKTPMISTTYAGTTFCTRCSIFCTYGRRAKYAN